MDDNPVTIIPQEKIINKYTLHWKIENFSCCWLRKGEMWFSPVFALDMNENTTKWKLVLCPRGYSDRKFVGCYLQRMKDDSSVEDIHIEFHISFLSSNHLNQRAHTTKYYRCSFYKGCIAGCSKFIKRDDLFRLEKANLLSKDTLTMSCVMRRVNGDIKERVEIFARTTIQIEQINFMCTIKEFSLLDPYQRVSFTIKSFSKKELAILSLFLSGQYGNEKICLEITYSNKNAKYFKMKSCILDHKGKEIESSQQQYCFDKFSNCEKYIFSLTKRNLMEDKEYYLPMDTLTLRFTCTASTGIAFKGIERIVIGSYSFSETSSCRQKLSESSTTLKDSLNSMYLAGFMPDLMLRTATTSFLVHKNILIAKSPVFKSWLIDEMEDDKFLDIPDVDSETLSRLLLYIYSDIVEDLELESAFRLYDAAEKYLIIPLKDYCYTFIKENIYSSSDRQKLVVADSRHADLQVGVEDYILEEDYSFLNSKTWQTLIKRTLNFMRFIKL